MVCEGEVLLEATASEEENTEETLKISYHLASQIVRLITDFPETTAFGYCHYQTKDGDDSYGNNDIKKPCCIAASAFLSGAAAASSSRNGVMGILDVLETKFRWGVARCWTVCQCLEQTDIDCGSSMNVALEALQHAPQVVENDVAIVKVQIIRRWDSFQAKQRLSMYDDSNTDFDFLTTWIDEDYYYHQCIGIVNRHAQLRIWDLGLWVLPPTSTSDPAHGGLDRATVAIRLTPGHGVAPKTMDWGGLKVPIGSWMTLLPVEIDDTIPNVKPIVPTLGQEEQLSILKWAFDSSHRRRDDDCRFPIPSTVIQPTIIISGGTHMSENPWPGVGVSRGIRSRFPLANILALDVSHDAATGMLDLTFDQTVALDEIMMPYLRGKESKRQHWNLVVDRLSRYPDAFCIPCTDTEIERCGESFETATSTEIDNVRGRLLCPSVEALTAIEKPGIVAAKAMGLFQVPCFITLHADGTTQMDVETFCKHHGYPVVVKGPKQGAAICYSWSQVQGAILSKWGSGGYVQKVATGFQHGLAFAAYKGELTAAVLMEKTSFNSNAKAWGGQFRPCPTRLYEAVRQFCVEYEWTGGSEIEFIEDVAGTWHVIDWNPRFPAWVFAGTYAGVNLSASLIQHALHVRSGGRIPFPESDRLAGVSATGGFSRTVVEIPTGSNMQQFAKSGFPGFSTSNYTKAGSNPHESPPLDMVAPGSVTRLCPEDASDVGFSRDGKQESFGEVLPDSDNRSIITREIQQLLPKGSPLNLQTPTFVLSRETVRESLLSHQQAIQSAIDRLDSPLKLQMCLSIKTQPHSMVLEEARKANYCGEVITTAEMRACLDAGWQETEIVMNGPGKWYDTAAGQLKAVPPTRLRCLFADSLSDLETIVSRLADPKDWLDAKYVGVRFAPIWVTRSRFGLDSKDPKVLLKAADLIKRIPAAHKLGLHMHCASSILGPTQWFGLAKGFLEVCRGFAEISGREPVLLDFGGGWPAHLLDGPDTTVPMETLLAAAQKAFPLLQTVQFEPGKSVTERAGAIITKILEIREVDRKTPRTRPKDIAGGDEDVEDSDSDEEEHRAIVVDACISDMGSLPTHVHPLLHYNASNDWQVMSAGKDQLWGSICMEFDILGANFSIPEDATPGDLIMIAFSGAYDMTMSYEFADGRERNIKIVA